MCIGDCIGIGLSFGSQQQLGSNFPSTLYQLSNVPSNVPCNLLSISYALPISRPAICQLFPTATMNHQQWQPSNLPAFPNRGPAICQQLFPTAASNHQQWPTNNQQRASNQWKSISDQQQRPATPISEPSTANLANNSGQQLFQEQQPSLAGHQSRANSG